MDKKFLNVFISVFLLLNMISGVSFAGKKDVADVVLQEIINELSNRMPRYINKYGATLFVADEPITRGTLLQALYEYDKKTFSNGGVDGTSISSEGVISKKDYDYLNTKVLILEKKLKNVGLDGDISSNIVTKSKSANFANIMEDLEVNMPILLDNTLGNSKVFKALEKKVNSSGYSVDVVANTSTSSSLVSQKSLVTIQKNIIDLNKKVDDFESYLASMQDGIKISESEQDTRNSTNTKILYDLKNLQKEINSINEKVSLLETKLARSKDVLLAKNLSSTSDILNNKQMQLINEKINSIREYVDDIKIEGLSNYSSTKNTTDIKRIEKRLSSLENSGKNYSNYSWDENSSQSSKSVGTIAKISLGLSFIAALFIAR